MNANEVIESYVTDVAVRLPRKQRNDVAFELRALLDEELQARAEAAGRDADASMATELLQGFGHPAEVAARYRPTLTIIDPEDGPAFLRATWIGLVIIWGLGLFERLRQPIESTGDLLNALGAWWGGTVLPSPWWPGLLVLGFGGTAWMRRRHPGAMQWKPRAGDRIAGTRASLVLAMVGIACGLYLLVNPTWILDVVWGGRAAPAAYEALTYVDGFRTRQGLVLFALLALYIPLLFVVIVQGRWSATVRRIELIGSLALCAAMAWTVLDGPVFLAQASDQFTKFALAVIIVMTLIGLGVKWFRSVKPAPN
jgi:hypothetical protein